MMSRRLRRVKKNPDVLSRVNGLVVYDLSLRGLIPRKTETAAAAVSEKK